MAGDFDRRRVRRWTALGKKAGSGGHGRVVRGAQIDELFRLHASEVLSYALRRTDPAAAEDVVAEVFAIAWRRADRIPETEPLLWLYGAARRVLANQHRGQRRRVALERALHPFTSDRAREPSEHGLAEAMAALKPADREILLLTAWEGLDASQVARTLGCSKQAAYTRLHRARQRLADELQPLSDSNDDPAARLATVTTR